VSRQRLPVLLKSMVEKGIGSDENADYDFLGYFFITVS
jgi:hypothetical protein